MIYFIKPEDANVVKIGQSDNPLQRLASLQTAHYRLLTLIKIIQNSDGMGENFLHFAFHSYQMKSKNEWYYLTGLLREFIDNLDETHNYSIKELQELCSKINPQATKIKIEADFIKFINPEFKESLENNKNLLIDLGFKLSTINSWIYAKRLPSFEKATELAQILEMNILDIPYRQIIINK